MDHELVKAYWRKRQGELVTCIWEQHKNTGSDSKASDILCNTATEMQCIDSQENDVADDLQRQECICHIFVSVSTITSLLQMLQNDFRTSATLFI